MKPAERLAVLLASVLLVAACGTKGGEGNGPAGPASDDGASRAGTTELKVVVSTGRGSGERTFTLTCDPAGGDHPAPEAACRRLDRMDNPFQQVPRNAMCTQVYGGPQTARVTGTMRGKPVDAEFDRTDGCQISRWDRHAALLVVKGGGGAIR